MAWATTEGGTLTNLVYDHSVSAPSRQADDAFSPGRNASNVH
jgi:hypothetical protein